MRSLIIAASIVLAGNTFADTFTHELTGIPSAEPTAADCRAKAVVLAAQFASNAPVESAVGLCTSVEAEGYEIHIRYQREERLSIVSTVRAGISLGRPGFFETLDECSALLAEELAVFEEQSGLTRLYDPYCSNLDQSSNDTPWMFRIEAAGIAVNRPIIQSTVFFGRILGYSRETFLAAVMAGMTDLGLSPRYARVDASIGMGYLTVFSYAAERIRMETAEIAKLETVENCEIELARFKQAVAGTNTVVSFCGAQHASGRAEVTGLFLEDWQFETIHTVDYFEDYAECSANRENILGQYRSDGLEVADGLCTLDEDNRWSVVLLVR